MLCFNKNTIRILATGALLTSPSVALAGGYGTAAADPKVERFAAQDGIYCPALDATIPKNLYSQMDCSAKGQARSAVADNRVTTNTPRRGLFGLLKPHQPSGRPEPQSDGPAPIATLARPDPAPTPSSGSDPTPVSDPSPNPGPTTTANVGKWDRMEDLGVTPDNWGDQTSDFYDGVDDFRRSENFNGDWSGFNPNN